MIERLSGLVGGLLAAAVLFAAMSGAKAAEPASAKLLQSHRWTLQSASDGAGRPIDVLQPAAQRLVVDFDGSRLAVHGVCNQMTGTWRLGSRGELLVGRLAATMKACETELMKADEALAAAIAAPLSIDVTQGAPPTLRLSTPTQQTLTFGGKPTLRSLYGPPKRLFLEVAAQTVDCTLPSGATGPCLQVREVRFDQQGIRTGSPGPWRSLAEPIEGYEHAAGVRTVLRVDRYERKPAGAGGTAALYQLDLVVESEAMGKR